MEHWTKKKKKKIKLGAGPKTRKTSLKLPKGVPVMIAHGI